VAIHCARSLAHREGTRHALGKLAKRTDWQSTCHHAGIGPFSSLTGT